MVCGTKEKSHSSFNPLGWFYHVWGVSWASNRAPGTRQKHRQLFFHSADLRNTPRKKEDDGCGVRHDSLGSGLVVSVSRVLGLEPALMPRVTGYTHHKRERVTSDASEQPEQPERTALLPDQPAAPNLMESSVAPSHASHAQLAQKLWSTDYVGLLLHELLQYADVAVCAAALSARR